MALTPDQIVTEFQTRFQTDDRPAIYRAPGRVNLIGEHTDYNLGYVFPIALEMACYTAIVPSDGHLLVHTHDFEEDFEIAVEDIATAKPRGDWSDYVLGVAQQLQRDGVTITGADVYIWSTVPLGAGLSSSAALEISTAFAFLGPRSMDPVEIVRVGQRAESQFVGMPCGIMDQYTAVFGRAGEAVQIDCRSLEHEYVKLPEDLRIVAVNSMVKHELGTSAYRERVAECQAAVGAIQAFEPDVKSLRDVSLGMFERLQDSIPTLPRRRARHIISDSQRVLDLAAAARTGDLAEMGRLFIASHRSMQYDYEISCEEVDFLVDTAIKIPGVYGARMTGGGFGGCTVNLIRPDAVDAFRERIMDAYGERYTIVPAFYDCVPAEGAGRVE